MEQEQKLFNKTKKCSTYLKHLAFAVGLMVNNCYFLYTHLHLLLKLEGIVTMSSG